MFTDQAEPRGRMQLAFLSHTMINQNSSHFLKGLELLPISSSVVVGAVTVTSVIGVIASVVGVVTETVVVKCR